MRRAHGMGTLPYCQRCSCPLVRLEGERKYRTLCVRCHEAISLARTSGEQACICADIERCKNCYYREVRVLFRERERAAVEMGL